MPTQIDEKELFALAKKIHCISKTLIAFYNENAEYICSYPGMCDFCREIRKNPQIEEKCIENDKRGFEICRKTLKPYIYTCHAGLIEVVTPIVYNNLLVGYIITGQITDKRDKKELLPIAKKTAELYGLDSELLAEYLQKVKYRTSDYIDALSGITQMCANYILMNSIISIRRDGLAHSIGLYLEENIRKSTSVGDICKKFGIGKSTLYEISKDNFGCGITEYIAKLKINKSKELLSSGASVGETAEAVGINDTNYFIRFFKKHTGVTPKQYSLIKKRD